MRKHLPHTVSQTRYCFAASHHSHNQKEKMAACMPVPMQTAATGPLSDSDCLLRPATPRIRRQKKGPAPKHGLPGQPAA